MDHFAALETHMPTVVYLSISHDWINCDNEDLSQVQNMQFFVETV